MWFVARLRDVRTLQGAIRTALICHYQALLYNPGLMVTMSSSIERKLAFMYVFKSSCYSQPTKRLSELSDERLAKWTRLGATSIDVSRLQ